MNEKEKNSLKGQKLLHYFGRDAVRFIQYDGFVNTLPDDLMSPDQDGDCLFSSETIELMTGLVQVRLLIVPGTLAKDVIRVLGKMTTWIQDDPGALKDLEAENQKRKEMTKAAGKLLLDNGFKFNALSLNNDQGILVDEHGVLSWPEEPEEKECPF